MSLKRVFKKLGKVAKAVAPLALTAIPVVGPVLGPAAGGASIFGAKSKSKGGKAPVLERIAKGVGIATDVLSKVAEIKAAKRGDSAVFQPVRRTDLSLRDLTIPDQTDALTPLDDAQTAALPPAFTMPRVPDAVALSTGGNMSIAAVLQSLGRLSTQVARSRVGKQVIGAAASGAGGALVALPGAGFRTGGGFPMAGGMAGRKRRRVNPTNVKALRRALRRVEGFIKIEKRVDKIVARAARSHGRARRSGFVRSKR